MNMNLDNTVLSLQIMNGAHLYDVRFISVYNGTKQKKSYHYKSMEDLEPGTVVIVPTHDGNSFAVGLIEEKADFDPDVHQKHPPLWICFAIDDPREVQKRRQQMDKQAKSKLAMGATKKAAKDYLEAAGLDLSDFNMLAPPAKNTIDAVIDDEKSSLDLYARSDTV